MKILITTLFTLCAFPAFAQTVAPTPSAEEIRKLINPPPKVYSAEDLIKRAQPVTVDQGFIDDSTEAFNEVVALRDLALTFLTGERPATEAERAGAQRIVEMANKFIDLFKVFQVQVTEMVKFQQEFITFQFNVMKQMQEIITNSGVKKNSALSKIWKGLKRAAELVIVFMAGRASGVVGHFEFHFERKFYADL